jgi:hypothetical protein
MNPPYVSKSDGPASYFASDPLLLSADWARNLQIPYLTLTLYSSFVSDTSILSLSKWRKKGVEPRIYSSYDFKRIMSRDFLLEGHLEFFRKFAEIFVRQGAPPASMTPAVNNSNNILFTPVESKEKIFYMLTLLPKGCQTKYLTLFWSKIFSNLLISPRVFEKIRNSPNGIFRAWKELIHKKTWSRKYRGTVPLLYSNDNCMFFFCLQITLKQDVIFFIIDVKYVQFVHIYVSIIQFKKKERLPRPWHSSIQERLYQKFLLYHNLLAKQYSGTTIQRRH